jgi:putative DNA primase/helicase
VSVPVTVVQCRAGREFGGGTGRFLNWPAATQPDATTGDSNCKQKCANGEKRLFSASLSWLCRLTTPDGWDSDNWKLNTPGGTVDLRTGKLLPHDPADYCTKITKVAPSSSTPELWLRFLARVTDDNQELQAFLKRMSGYALTGDTSEHALFFLWGTGKKGKSTFINTLTGILHDYARVAPPEVFTMQKSGEKHPTCLAGLQGARLCTATETDKGAHLAESQVKSLTGGDKITARYMRKDFFDYTPCFKLLIGGNNKPTLRSVDEAIRRRINLLPFVVTIPESERDSTLGEKLKKEWPGILSWAIEGSLEWQRDGLKPPTIVQAATHNYLDDEDILEGWLAERAVIGKRYETSSAAVFADWKLWTETNNEFTGSQRSFSMNIEGRSGITKSDSRQGRGFRGVGLKSDQREESQ